MAAIGHIKEVTITDGQITAVVETGTGQAVTAKLMAAAGAEFYPLAGDAVLFHWAGQEVIISAVLHGDASTAGGEALVFSRNASGDVVASIYLKADGKVIITTTGAEVGAGGDAVAMSTPINTFLDTLAAAVSPGGVGIVTPSPGAACPVAVAIRAAMSAAFPPALSPASTGSTNLRAD